MVLVPACFLHSSCTTPSVPQNFAKLDGQTGQQNFGYFEYYAYVHTKLLFLDSYCQDVGAKITF
jgi:hypothetical protein